MLRSFPHYQQLDSMQYPFVKRIKYSKVSLFVIVPSKSNTAIFFFPSSILITNRLGQKKSKASQG